MRSDTTKSGKPEKLDDLNQNFAEWLLVEARRNRRLRACLIGAAAYGAFATLAAVAIWGAR